MVRSVAVVVLYLAGASAALGTFARNCTPLAVDALVSGGSISLVLYALALVPLISHPVPRRRWVWLAPALLPLAYLGWWTGRFGLSVWFGQQNVCELLTGMEGFEADGREPVIALIYFAMTAGAAIGLGWSWLRAAPGRPSAAGEASLNVGLQ